MIPVLILVLVVIAILAWCCWPRKAVHTQVPLSLADFTPLGVLRLEQVLGPGGTGTLNRCGNGCFWERPDGKVAYFQIGQYAPEWFPSGWPIIEFEIDPAVQPGFDMNTAPKMKYKRTIGDFFHGHIIAASGREYNWVPGGFAPPEDLGNGILRFRWDYGDGYTGYPGYPQYCMTDLNYQTGAFQSYGPWKIDVTGHRHVASQIIKLPTWFRDAHCPGYSYAGIGGMYSGAMGSPFGSSLIAIEDFDPKTKPVATNATDPATVKSIYLIHHGPDTKMRRPPTFALCGWDQPGYDCRLGSAIVPAQPLFGGTANNENTGVEENDTQSGVVWCDLPDRVGLMFFFKMTAPPKGYHDPNWLPHAGYGAYNHGSISGSGAIAHGCCHAVEGESQFDPTWVSTGPFANHHLPVVSIYSPDELVAVREGRKKQHECLPMPGAELEDWGDVDPLFKVPVAKTANDQQSIIFFSGTNWIDPRDRRLYVMSGYDFTSEYGRLPHLSVYAIKGGDPGPITPPIEPPIEPPVEPGERRRAQRRNDAHGRRHQTGVRRGGRG
jgi:hypothetical protein